ncbi:MAG TPA: hypothetical protein VG432_06655 [Gemmatimonadaceae bacterium]|nr:hypothetical protein [Gemmatimonadaceae bacterium]
MNEKPSAAARAWDAAALALVVGGAALYLVASQGMHDLLGPQARTPTSKSIHFERWLHFRTMSNIGFSLVAGGVAVGIAAWYRSRRELAARGAVAPAPSPDAVPDVPPE